MSTSRRDALRGLKDSSVSVDRLTRPAKSTSAITPGLVFALELQVRVGRAIDLGTTPHGTRRIVPILGGTFAGSGLKGKILSGGADQQLIRSDGVAEISARYVMRTHGGDLIHVINSGIRRGRPEVMARLNSGHEANPAEYYFRTVPRFESSAPRCAWLMQSIFIGWGQRLPSKVIISVWKLL
jgi:hypothetical protein